MSLLAAIDQGTTGTRCFLFDLAGRVVASAYREHAQFFPHPGWVEHDALEIRDNVDRVVAEAVTGGPRGGAHVTDPTNASRTLLCALATLSWDPELFDRFEVPAAALARIEPSIAPEPYGWTRSDGSFGARIPVCADLGDQQAALF